MKIGRYLKLEIFGESHAPFIGMRMEGFPENAAIDMETLQAFLERRAPGRDELSTTRREPDIPEITRRGKVIEGIIRNTDVRSRDYEKYIPRPGHADYPNYVKNGCIPPGGGSNSGRMTAAMCIAGGICLQELARRGITIKAELESVGDILAAKATGDSVGGIVHARITGLPVGLGGPMFEGLDGALAFAMWGIPGVKGVEFGNGFAAAALKGSENNDGFFFQDGKVVTMTNKHGGVLGGMASGMPVEFRVALKPTPSIYISQPSVNLLTHENVNFCVRGRHDPCIARRSVPVVEALAAFTVLDLLLEAEDIVEFHDDVANGKLKLKNVVIDANVARLYPHLAEGAIAIIPSGEENKTVETLRKLWSAFAAAGIGRRDRVTAIGGGVTGDLTGFAAATWMRGISWVNVPTSLLSMVDSSYGGKTACDLSEGKNLAGAFHPPECVLIDENFLKTLPERELRCGRAEMLKHELIAGKNLPGVRENLAVKMKIVRSDPYERIGERMKLNCGHTIGHAVEKACGFRLSHGECVAIGCVAEAAIAERMQLAEPGWSKQVAEKFAAAGLPVEVPAELDREKLADLVSSDKKRDRNVVNFALPCAPGDVRVLPLSRNELLNML